MSTHVFIGASLLPALTDVITRARERIMVCMYQMQPTTPASTVAYKRLWQALMQAPDEGVACTAILSKPPRQIKSFYSLDRTTEELLEAGWVIAHMPENPTYHVKLLAADGQHAFVGSHNWTQQGLCANVEATMYSNDDDVARTLEVAMMLEAMKRGTWYDPRCTKKPRY